MKYQMNFWFKKFHYAQILMQKINKFSLIFVLFSGLENFGFPMQSIYGTRTWHKWRN